MNTYPHQTVHLHFIKNNFCKLDIIDYPFHRRMFIICIVIDQTAKSLAFTSMTFKASDKADQSKQIGSRHLRALAKSARST